MDLLNKVDGLSLVEVFEKFNVGGKSYFARVSDLARMPYNASYAIVTPISFNQNILQSGGYVDFDIPNNLGKIDSIVFQMTVHNTDAVNALGLLPLEFLISRVEIMCNGSLKETIYSQNLYTSDILSTSEMNAQYALGNGYNAATYNVAANIAASASKYLQSEIQCFLEKLYMSTLQNTQIRIRVYFNNGSSVITSTSPAAYTAAQVSNMNVYVRGREFTPEIKAKLDRRFLTDSHFSRVTLRRQQIINLGAVTAGTYVNQTLSAFTGHFNYLRLLLLPSGANQETQLAPSYVALSTVTLQDSGGRPWAFSDIPGQLILQSFMPQLYNTLATTVVNPYELDFCTDPVYTFNSGCNTGTLTMDGRFLLKFRSAANVANADLFILSLQEAVLIQQPSGEISVLEV